MDPDTNEFVFVPIPEVREDLRPSLARTYDEVAPALNAFGVPLPQHLPGKAMHLDPDFEHLTYGDKNRRGRQLLVLEQGGQHFVVTLWRDWLTKAVAEGFALNDRQRMVIVTLVKNRCITNSEYQAVTGAES